MRQISDIAQQPAWSFDDFAQMIGLAPSTLEQVINEHPAPFFLLGRKRYIVREDAIEWLAQMSLRTAHTARKRKGRT